MVQGQNFHILNGGKILTAKKKKEHYLHRDLAGTTKNEPKMQKSLISKPEIKILLYFKYEPAMKEVLKVVSYMQKCKTRHQFKLFRRNLQ
jgi:hypothetical protein